MALTFDDIDFRTELPRIPDTAPVVALSTPCVSGRKPAVEGLVEALGIDAPLTVDLPHGYATGGHRGQVEVFAASGAVRGRSVERINAHDDESRQWAHVTREGDSYRLSEATDRRLTEASLRLLDSLGLTEGQADAAAVLEQWAHLDDKGTELESGPGRATVRLNYEAEGLPLLGPGAKTNLHFDPDSSGDDGVLVRFFHVMRPARAAVDVRTISVEQAFAPLLGQEWSGLEVMPGQARMVITAATYGLLALPADVPQQHAAPTLMVEGYVEGAVGEGGKTLDLLFGRYLPLSDARALTDAGFAAAGPVIPGTVVPSQGKGE